MPIAANTKAILSKGIRTFHDPARTKYLLPTDTEECSRLIRQHKAITTTLNGLFSAPITKQLENGITVLDAGCGPGCWSIDMAVKYKNSQFHGVDILDTQFPQNKDKPANTRFVVGDLADNIPYPNSTFDFIYQRLLYFAFTKEQWLQNLKELLRVLKPGGCVELIEYDHTEMLKYGPNFEKQLKALEKYQISRGMYPYVNNNLCNLLKNAGFSEVTELVKQQAFCNSGRRASKEGIEVTGDAILCAFESLRHGVSEFVPEWKDPSAYKRHLKNCRLEALTNNAQLYCTVHVARKEPIDQHETI